MSMFVVKESLTEVSKLTEECKKYIKEKINIRLTGLTGFFIPLCVCFLPRKDTDVKRKYLIFTDKIA